MSNIFNPANVTKENASPVQVSERQPDVIQKTVFESKIEQFRQKGTEEQKRLISALDKYVQDTFPFEKNGVTPRSISDAVGGNAQHMLFQAIFHVIERTNDEEFKKLWNIILAYFDNYGNTVFNGRWVYRWAYAWSWGEEKLDLFQRLINLLMITADPNTRRKSLRTVDISRTVEENLSEEGRNRVIAFYQQ